MSRPEDGSTGVPLERRKSKTPLYLRSDPAAAQQQAGRQIAVSASGRNKHSVRAALSSLPARARR